MAIVIKTWHSTGKLNIRSVNDNESIKLSRNTSWSEISSADKSKECPKYKPVRITLLSDSKPIHQSVRKRAQPERLKVLSYDKEVRLTQSNNVKEKSQQKNPMKMNLHNKNIQSNSKSNRKKMSLNLNKCNGKIRRNLNLNFVSLKQQTEKNTNTALPEVQEKNQSICSNLEKYRNRKSFLLPPNFIKNKYLNERGSKVIPSSTVSMKNDAITNVDVLEANENLHIKNSNVQVCSFKKGTHDNSQTEVNSKSPKLLHYDCENKRNTLHKSVVNGVPLYCDESELIRKNIIPIDNKIQKQEQCNINRSNFSMNKSTDNLKNISDELNNIILTKGSEVSVNDNNIDFSRKDCLYVDKNTIVSLKSYLEDMLKVFQDNALKTDLLLQRINKILHVNADSIEELVPIVDSNDEMIKETLKLNLNALKIIEDNNIDIVTSRSKKSNNIVRIKEPVELSEEEKENIIKNLEFESNHINIDHTESLQSTPNVFQITIPNCTNFGESALQDYTNLKKSLNFLVTPLSRKLQPRIQKNTNIIPNIPKDKSYVSTKIFTELQHLYDE